MVNIDISDIKAFVTTAELGSISAAAQYLNHLQSNLTVKIKKIENHYKTELFLRTSKGVIVTDSGKRIYEQYKQLLSIWSATEQGMFDTKKSTLRFGVTTPIRGNHVSLLMQMMYERYPNLSPTIRTGFTRVLEQEIEAGVIDFGLLLGEPASKNLDYVPNGEDALVLVGKHQQQPLRELLKNSNMLCMSDKSCYFGELKDLYNELDVPHTDNIQISEMDELINFSQVGLGVSLVPERLIKQYDVQHYVTLPPAHHKTMKAYIVSRKQYTFSEVEKYFIALTQSKSLF